MALKVDTGLATALALGCCDALLIAASFTFMQGAFRETTDVTNNRVDAAAKGLLAHTDLSHDADGESLLVVARDVSVATTVTLWLAVFTLEDLTFAHFRYGPALGLAIHGKSVLGQQVQLIIYGIILVIVHIALNTSLIIMVRVAMFPYHFLILHRA